MNYVLECLSTCPLQSSLNLVTGYSLNKKQMDYFPIIPRQSILNPNSRHIAADSGWALMYSSVISACALHQYEILCWKVRQFASLGGLSRPFQNFNQRERRCLVFSEQLSGRTQLSQHLQLFRMS